MIRQITSNNLNSPNVRRGESVKQQRQEPKAPTFTGALDLITAPLLWFERSPMLNVTFLDVTTAIAPRTIEESKTNSYAGFEAFRRESSGLVINCLIPGLIVAGIASAIQKPIIGGKTNLSECWANEDTIKLIAKHWQNASSEAFDSTGKALFEGEKAAEKAKAYNTIKSIFSQTQGAEGFTIEGDARLKSLKPEEFDAEIKKLAEQSVSGKYSRKERRAIAKEVKKARNAIIERTHFSEKIKIGSKEYHSQSLSEVVDSAPKFIRELNGKYINETDMSVVKKGIEEYSNKAGKLVRAKSLLGLGVILPLAVLAQPINRWLTAKASGTKGAPIYKDYAKNLKTSETKNEEKKQSGLLRQKFISVGAMISVAMLSIMKKPSLKMLDNIAQFKGIFPSMDQARLISTATFASRMASSEDKNELREATFRDIATFSAFYFLGDYVAKGIATGLQKTKALKNKGIQLVNVLESQKENSNVLEKFWHWAKNTALKSTDEIYGKTKEATKFGKNMRALCQLGNILFSLGALGIIIPKMYRKKTDKEREKELKQMGIEQQIIEQLYSQNFTSNNINSKPAYQAFFTARQ